MAKDPVLLTEEHLHRFPKFSHLPIEERRNARYRRRILRDQRRLKRPRRFLKKSPHLARLAAIAKQLVRGAQDRAKVHRIPCTIEVRWVLEKLETGHCEMTGLPFVISNGARSNFVPSIDRNVPAEGYTPENTRVVIWGYNSAKASGTDEDVMRMAEALVRRKALGNVGTTSTEPSCG